MTEGRPLDRWRGEFGWPDEEEHLSLHGVCRRDLLRQSINQSINLGSKGKHRHHHLTLTEFDFADQVGKQGEDL